jgi:hypothetical protein
MEKWDKGVKDFINNKQCMPMYALLSPAFYEELKDFLGIEIDGYVQTYHGIVIYVSTVPDISNDLIFSGCD